MATLGRRRLSRALACCATVGVLCAGVAAAASAGAKHDANAKHDTATAACSKMTHVRLVLQWLAQAQFAGYYAAKDNGYYAKQCLDVSIQQGGVNIVPQQVLTSGNADFAISQVPKSIATREQGADLVDISQVFQRGAFLQVSWKDSNITTLQSLKATRVGSWGFGNDDVLRAAMAA